MVERIGGTVVHVMGEVRNLKITVPEDLAVARSYANAEVDDG
jgi:2-C-methyl-D-erythritol 4-phosphate cytidylyltransferase